MNGPDGLPELVPSRPRVARGQRFGSGLFRAAFVPALLCSALVPWVVRDASGAWGFTSTTRPGATAPALLLVLLFVWCAEQLYPQKPDWNPHLLSAPLEGLRRLGHDLVYLFGVTWLSALLIGAAEPYFTVAVRAWPAQAPFAAKVALAFLLMELLSYLVHRAAHGFRLLWQFHSTHHVITELSGLKAVRTHPVDNVVFWLGRVAPLVWLGAGRDEVLAAVYLGGVLGILAHANLSVSSRGLGLLVNFPRFHSVHHSADLAEANSNFGCHTVLWDRVFGTFRPEPKPGLVLGVNPVGPRTLWQELAWPFYRWVSPRAE